MNAVLLSKYRLNFIYVEKINDFFPYKQLFINEVVANKHRWSSGFQAKTAKMPRPMQKIEKSTFFLMGLEENQDHFNVWRVERRLFC